MASWTIPQDVYGSWIGGDAPSDTAQIELWIGKAEREIRRRIPDLVTRLDLEAELDPPSTELLENIKDVVVAMVTRVFRNPEGVRQRNETTGPFTGSVTYGGDLPGALTLTADEIDKLSGFTSSGQAFNIDMIPATSPFSTLYDPVYPWGPWA